MKVRIVIDIEHPDADEVAERNMARELDAARDRVQMGIYDPIGRAMDRHGRYLVPSRSDVTYTTEVLP